MNRLRRVPRYQPRPALGSMIAGVGLTAALLLVAVELLHVYDPADPAPPLERLLGILLVIFGLQAVAALAQGAGLVVVLLGRLLAFRRSGRLRAFLAGAPAAILAFLFVAPRLVDLFSGPWIAAQSWRPAALVVLLLGGAALLLRVAAALARSYIDQGRLGTRLVIVAAVLAPVLFLVDAHEALARKQQSLHDLLAFAALVATGLAGSRFTLLGWRRAGLVQVAVGLLAVLAIVLDVMPGDSTYLREVLVGRSRVLGRVLRDALPPGDDSGVAVDRDFLRALDRRRPVPPARLDALLPDRRRLDLVLVTVDTLRHDALGLTGGDAERTPTMDAFVRKSRFLPRAWTQFPSSRYAIASMFTGRYPTASRLYETSPGDRVVSPEATEVTLAELLAAQGFATEAVTAFPPDFYRREEAQLGRGFTRHWNDVGDKLGAGERVVERALEILAEPRPEGQRLFLWVHLFDPHRPYLPRGSRGAGAPARERYRGEVSHADACLARFFAALDFDRSLVVLHSDHGEEFDDHGGSGHHSSLYEEQICVPLALRIPGVAPGFVNRPVGLVDLRATLLELFGLGDDPRDQGRSFAIPLLGIADLEAPPPAAYAQFREPRFVQGALDALVLDRTKIIHDRGTGLFELYDLEADPGETRNLALVDRPALDRMRARLAAMRRHLGLDVRPEADRDGLELVREIVAKPAPLPEDMDRLVDRVRDPEPMATEAIDRLLAHPDARLRRLAILRTATWPTTPAYLTLQDWAASEERGRQQEAALGLALLGGEGFREDVLQLEADYRGEARLLGLLARYAGGETVLAEAVHQLLADPNNDRDLETLGFAVLGRLGDPRGLVVYYTRLVLQLKHPEQRVAIFEGTSRFPFAQAAPVLRLLLAHPDRALRARADALLADRPEHATWLAAARQAERLAQRARDLGVRPEVLPEALAFYRKAQDEMTRVGVLDWGLVMEVAFLFDVCGRRTDLAAVVEPWLEALPAAESFARNLAARMVGLARHADRPFALDLEPVAGEVPREGESGRAILLVRVSVGHDSAGLVGGMGLQTEYLAAVPLDRLDRPQGEPASLPLPLTALLPGEQAVLAVPILIDSGLLRTPRVGVRLGRGDSDLVAPIVLEPLR